MQKKISKLSYFSVCFAFFVFFTLYCSDQIVNQLMQGFTYSNDIITLKYIENTGAAFSILKDSREVLILVSAFAIFGIFFYIIRHISTISMKSIFFLSMLSAGIGGNLHERIALGFVRDYVQLNSVNFPVFNISDILINVSVIALVIVILLKKNL